MTTRFGVADPRTSQVHHADRSREAMARLPTATALVALGALHVAWGRGSTFPYTQRADLNDAVIGRRTTPSPAACFAIAAG